MVYKESKKAAEGIGTLIIFIALILVAAVAAGVLIQTASSLQSKSLDVGRQSQEKITWLWYITCRKNSAPSQDVISTKTMTHSKII